MVRTITTRCAEVPGQIRSRQIPLKPDSGWPVQGTKITRKDDGIAGRVDGGPPQPRRTGMDWKLELVVIPVSDVDRAKAFYTEQVGFNADHDHQVNEELRFVQLTPPGSACSIAFGTGITDATPGSVKGLQVVVSDIGEAHDHLSKRGVDVSDVEALAWGSFVYF